MLLAVSECFSRNREGRRQGRRCRRGKGDRGGGTSISAKERSSSCSSHTWFSTPQLRVHSESNRRLTTTPCKYQHHGFEARRARQGEMREGGGWMESESYCKFCERAGARRRSDEKEKRNGDSI